MHQEDLCLQGDCRILHISMHILIFTQCSFGILHKLEVSKNKALALSQEAWCHVYGLLQGASLGYELLAHVFAHLDILETDYFGLQYTDEKSVTRWIDQDKSIKKQTCKQRGGSLHVYSLMILFSSYVILCYVNGFNLGKMSDVY